MTQILKGKPVADALTACSKERADILRSKGIIPTLAIVRVGERDDDLSYERSAMKRCAETGIDVKNVILPADAAAEVFYNELEKLNADKSVHGILMFRPLPKHIDGDRACRIISPEKDIDGCTDGSLAGVFAGRRIGFPPCTAQAAMEILKFYGIDPKGKSAAVIGRSLVIGRPVSMLLMHANATVTTCHTKTPDVASVTSMADIVITASGQPESVGREYLREGQTVIDVGISWNEEKQKLCGDVKFEEADGLVAALTPVPGGVGSVTTSILASHVLDAAEKMR